MRWEADMKIKSKIDEHKVKINWLDFGDIDADFCNQSTVGKLCTQGFNLHTHPTGIVTANGDRRGGRKGSSGDVSA